MSKHVCKISHLNSKRLLRKLQKILGGYFILPHPVDYFLVCHMCLKCFVSLWVVHATCECNGCVDCALFNVVLNVFFPREAMRKRGLCCLSRVCLAVWMSVCHAGAPIPPEQYTLSPSLPLSPPSPFLFPYLVLPLPLPFPSHPSP